MSDFQLYKKAISATGTTTENEPIIKSDGASSNVMQWLSNNEASNITISEDASNNLDLVVSAGNVGIGVTPAASQVLQVKVASDVNLSVSHSSGKVRVNAISDNSAANVPMEFTASSYSLTGGLATFNADATLKSAAGVQTTSTLNFLSTNYSSYGSTYSIDSKITSNNTDGGNAYGSNLKFYTNDSANALTERMSIAQDGLTIVKNPSWPLKNEISNSGFDVWSNSTLCEVTSGAAPVTVGADAALVNNLVSNGGFDSANTGWTDGQWSGGATGSIANVSGGATGNCVELTATAGYRFVYQEVTGLTAGKLYHFSCWGKDGTDAGKVCLGDTYGYQEILGLTEFTTAGGAYFDFTFEATTSSCFIQFVSSYPATDFLIDTVCLYEVVPGCVNTSSNLAMDGWWKDLLTKCWRQHNDGGTLTHDGSFYATQVYFPAGGYELAQPAGSYNQAEWTQRFAGRTVTFGCWMKSDNATLIRIADSEGYSDVEHSDSGNWQWLEVTRACDATISAFSVRIRGDATETVYISQPMLVFGSAIGSGNYSRPSGEIVNCEAYINFTDTASPVAADDKILNLEALSSGKIPKGAKAIQAWARTTDSGVANEKGIQWGADSIYNYELTLLPQVSTKRVAAHGRVSCNEDGDIYQKVTVTGSTLSDSSLQATAIELR